MRSLCPLFFSVCLLGSSSLWAPPCSGQDLLYRFDGSAAGDFFGIATGEAGDVDGDGLPDVIAGAFQHDGPAGRDSGEAVVYSGRDGSVLYRWSGPSESAFFGWAIAGGGDVNGDGFDDVLVSAYAHDDFRGRVFVYSGSDGSILHLLEGGFVGQFFGYAVDMIGDIDADGYEDFAVTSHDHIARDKADGFDVYSGWDASHIVRIDGDQPGHGLGTSIAGRGDIDGDGTPDVVVGAPFDDRVLTDAGSVRAYSGVNFQVIHHWDGDSTNERFGLNLDIAGDVDADGFADVIIGGNGDDLNGSNSGSATVVSGASGSLLFRYSGHANESMGNVGAAGDVNGDGHHDVIIGAPSGNGDARLSGYALLVSGRSGSLLYTFSGDSIRDSFGRWARGVRDVDNDGYADVAVGAPGEDFSGSSSGSVFVYRGDDLYLQGPSSITEGETLELESRGGRSGRDVVLFTSTIDGAFMSRWLAHGQFGSDEIWKATFLVPDGVAGHEIEFITYALDDRGVMSSSDHLVSFE